MGEKKTEHLWDFKELQAFLKMPRTTLMFHIAKGTIPSVKLGRHRRFIPDEVLKALRKLPA